MGIKLLNRFLRLNCADSIKRIHLSDLRGKTIAIDTSIYLYRFAKEGGLIEGFYSMLTALNGHRITPIFVFDGKAPEEKADVIEKRREDRRDAQRQYKELLNAVKTADEIERQDIETELDSLRKQIIYIKRRDVEEVKNLMDLMGAFHVDADGEADALCARLVHKKRAHACLSEDMDMFVYGCPRVLRYLSLVNETVVMYNQQGILAQLKLNQNEFQDIAVLAGTDYNRRADREWDLNEALRAFCKYKQSSASDSFFDWLARTKPGQIDHLELVATSLMFRTDNVDVPAACLQTKHTRRASDEELSEFLRAYGFIFVSV
jgi:flap endonuclease-1